MRLCYCVVAVLVMSRGGAFHCAAQFLEEFNGSSLTADPRGLGGWAFYTGDGDARIAFVASGKGYASIQVDATSDRRGVWWALIRRHVSQNMDLALLRLPKHALRIEARIRTSHAPRRVNLHLNTQRTTDFHSHLMEFDISDTVAWHTISMTTRDFDAVPGDSVYGQLALMDWGLGQYHVDVDHVRVDIVNTDSAGSDKGVQVPYHPPAPAPTSLHHHLQATADAIVDLEYPDLNFNDWSTQRELGRDVLLTVTGTQIVVMRWDLAGFRGKSIAGPGVLELTTHSLQRSPEHNKDFGMVRTTEITGGMPLWNQSDVTYVGLCRGEARDDVLNPQMIIDGDVQDRQGGRNLITISQPVLQRMIDGTTLGLALRPLGAVVASFYAMENPRRDLRPTLHFSIESVVPSQ